VIKKICAVFLIAFSTFAQQQLRIDDAITESIKYLSENLTDETKINLFVVAESKDLAEYVAEKSAVRILNNTKLLLFETFTHTTDEKEMFELSKKTGVESVILLNISKLGGNYRLLVKSTNTTDKRIQAIHVFSVVEKEDKVLAELIKTKPENLSRPNNSLKSGNYDSDNKRLYLGLRFGGGIGLSAPGKMYDWIDKEEGEGLKWKSDGGSFDIAPFVRLQVVDAFAVQTEALFTRYGYGGYKFTKNYPEDSIKKGDFYSSSRAAMVIPVLAQLTLAERKVKIFAGPHFSVNTGKIKDSWKENGIKDSETWSLSSDGENYIKYPPVGLTTGTAFGFKANPGYLFFDIRYLTDLGMIKDKLEDDDGKKYEEDWVRRAKLSFTFGFEFGVGKR
jgi:hypothetical protein